MTDSGDGKNTVDFHEEALPHMDAVFRFALRLSGAQDQAEDLVQETFLRAYRAWDQYTPGTQCKSLLFTIFRNVFLRQGDFFASIVDEEVLSRIQELPEDYRTAVILSDLEGFTYQEIADMTDVPVGTVKSRLFRGRRVLQNALYDYAVSMGYIPETPKGAEE